MKVIATAIGYYGKLREVGDEFEVEDGLEASWFEPVEPVNTKKKRGADVNSSDADLV